MNWQSWKLSDWNAALVKAVFLDSARLDMPVTRIQASGKFLAECAGEGSDDATGAMQSFISSFGKDEAKIRGQFLWSKSLEKKFSADGLPSIFAALYLSLLAASADENTFDEGNFRARFKELLHPVQIRTISFECLPNLWTYMSNWTRTRAKRLNDCRQLILPAASDYERLIGYSKRLAFPAYRDEVKLQRVLAKAELDKETDFRSVAKELSRHRSDFSWTFQQELDLFVKFVSKSEFSKAFESPLWGAVQSITWEQERTAAASDGTYCLGIDVSDPGFPDLYLIADEGGRSVIGASKEYRAFPGQQNPKYAVMLPRALPWTPEALLDLGLKSPFFAKSRLGKQLAAGCVALFPDKYGNLTLEGEYFEDGPAGILLEGKCGTEFSLAAKKLGIKFVDAKADGRYGTWKVLIFDSISSQCLASLSYCLPQNAASALRQPWRPPRPTIAQAAWYGQSMLFNPASVPSVGMQGAESGSFELIDSLGDVNASGSLEEQAERFRIPPRAILDSPKSASIRLTLSGSGFLERNTAVSCSDFFPLAPPSRIAEPDSWLTDGTAGVLVAVDVRPELVQMGSQRRKFPLHRLPQLAVADQEAWCEPIEGKIDDLPPVADWISEALCLRLQGRSILSFADINLHVAPACEAAGMPSWIVRKLIFAAGWLMRVERRSSPFGLIAAARRTIAHLDEAMSTVRIVGMLSKSERLNLQNSLTSGESLRRIVSRPAGMGLGAVELTISDPGRMLELAKIFDLDVLDKKAFPAPLQLPIQYYGTLPEARKAFHDCEMEAWNPGKHCWDVVAGPMAEAVGSIFRTRGSQRWHYQVSTGSGFLTTDSEVWAFIFRLAATGIPVGEVAFNGDCAFNEELPRLPLLLTRWWLHWGGGYININERGGITLGGATDGNVWTKLADWMMPDPSLHKKNELQQETAIQRRKLALRLRSRSTN